MSKETKIGLAVIGVLLVAFGALFFRYLGAGRSLSPIEHDSQAKAVPISSEGMIPKMPNVVVTSPSAMDGTASRASWDASNEPAAHSGDVAPAESYMPGEPGVAAPLAAAPLAEDPSAVPLESEAASDESAAPARSNPFQRQPANAESGAEAEPVSPGADAASKPVTSPRGNPLRRTSAEEPLEGLENPATDAVEPAYEPADAEPPAANRYQATEPAATADPFEGIQPAGEAQSASEPQPASKPQFGDAPEPTPPVADEVQGAEPPVAEQPAESPTVADDFDQPAQPIESQPVQDRRAVRSDPFEDRRPTAAPSTGRWESEPAEEPVAAPTAAPFANERVANEPVAAEPVAAAPPVIENGKYTVQPGDTLWSISEKVYGTGGYFKALAAHNRADLPRSDQLTVGNPIAVPSTSDLERDYPSLCPKQRKSALVQPGAAPAPPARRSGKDVYIVAEGDTLFDIARFELGKAARWAEIYELNRAALGEDFDYLRPGTELVMPARERGGEVSRASATRYE